MGQEEEWTLGKEAPFVCLKKLMVRQDSCCVIIRLGVNAHTLSQVVEIGEAALKVVSVALRLRDLAHPLAQLLRTDQRRYVDGRVAARRLAP